MSKARITLTRTNHVQVEDKDNFMHGLTDLQYSFFTNDIHTFQRICNLAQRNEVAFLEQDLLGFKNSLYPSLQEKFEKIPNVEEKFLYIKSKILEQNQPDTNLDALGKDSPPSQTSNLTSFTPSLVNDRKATRLIPTTSTSSTHTNSLPASSTSWTAEKHPNKKIIPTFLGF